MSTVTVQFVGMAKPGYLPIDLNNPGYWTSASKDSLTLVARYFTPTEWAELANHANKLVR